VCRRKIAVDGPNTHGHAEVAELADAPLEGLAVAIPWGFESPSRHTRYGSPNQHGGLHLVGGPKSADFIRFQANFSEQIAEN
jgi:hypothetical protein